MGDTLVKNNIVSEPALFRKIIVFASLITQYILNLSKDYKLMYGQKIIDSILCVANDIKKAYFTKKHNEKYAHLLNASYSMDEAATAIKVLSELKCFSLQQESNIYKHVGEILEDLNKWKNYVSEAKNNDNQTENK